MKNYPKVSIVVNNFKRVELLEKCLKSLLRTNYPNYEIIVVDCLTPDIEIWMKNKFPSVKLIHFSEDIGHSASYDVGFKYSDGKYIAFLDDDTTVDREWVKEAIEIMESVPKIGAAQCKILIDNNCLDCAGGFIDFYGFGRERGTSEQDHGQYNNVDEIFYAKGAAIIIVRDVLEKVGSFDPLYWFYYDETDVCWRIWLAGYKIVFIPSSIVYHNPRTSSSDKSKFLVYHHSKNRIMTLIKNYSVSNLIKSLPILLLVELFRACYLIIKGNPIHAKAVLEAIKWNVVNMPTILKSRRKVQKNVRKVSDKYIMKYIRKPNFIHLWYNFKKYHRI